MVALGIIDRLRERMQASRKATGDTAAALWREYAKEIAKGDDASVDRLAPLIEQLSIDLDVVQIHRWALDAAAQHEAAAKVHADAHENEAAATKSIDRLLAKRREIDEQLAAANAKREEARQALRQFDAATEHCQLVRLRFPRLFGLDPEAPVIPSLAGANHTLCNRARSEFGITIPRLGEPWDEATAIRPEGA